MIGALLAEFQGLNLLLEYIFVMIVRCAVADGLIASGLLYALQNGRLGAVLNGIHLEPDAPWSVEKLASLANMSRSKFAACFARTMRMTPMGYFSAWRMKVAQDLLREGARSRSSPSRLATARRRLSRKGF